MYYVYILTNKYNKVLYIGVTNNFERRIIEQKRGLVKGFTKKYNLTKLVYFAEFSNIQDAIVVERKIKGWLRRKKIQLIESENSDWHDLSTVILSEAKNL
jgi:putative endonuclease